MKAIAPQAVFAPMLTLLLLEGCAVSPDGLGSFQQEPSWRVEEQTGSNGRWEAVGTARFEREEHCLAVIDETQRCRLRR